MALTGDLPADEIRPTDRPIGDDLSESEIQMVKTNYENRKKK